MDDAELGRHIRRARQTAGLSIRQFADALGIDAASVSRTEAGTRALKARELVTISEALNVPLDSIIGGGTNMEAEAAERLAKALAEPVGDATVGWLTAVSRVAAYYLTKFDTDEDSDSRKFGDFMLDLPEELAATIIGDPLPVPRKVFVRPNTAGVVSYMLSRLPEVFQIIEQPDDTDEDTEHGR